MKTLFLVFITCLSLHLPERKHHTKIVTTNIDTSVLALENKKEAIDDYLKKHQKEIITLAKVAGKKKPVRVLNNKWPDGVEYSYNILKNKSGKIIFIMQSPFSESGDWDIEYHHYFDEDGKTYAFSREESVFGDIKGGIIRMLLFKYYGGNFNIIGTTTKFMDVNFKPIKVKEGQYDFRDDKYSIHKSVGDCLVAYHIQ
ncbi:MAG TPA: hypothetical protein VK668_21955 [Mucilaginibacter sp.]|nr:hypothetical protein [Mucilaginibacter sp.]